MATTDGTSSYDKINSLNTRQYANDDVVKIATSTNIEIEFNGRKIGLIQSLRSSERRDITTVLELGTEGAVQKIPGNYTGGDLSTSHFRIYGKLLYQTLDIYDLGAPRSYIANFNPVAHLAQQRLPITIKVALRGAARDEDNSINRRVVEVYHGCWIKSYSYDARVGEITISEDVELEYTWKEVQVEKEPAWNEVPVFYSKWNSTSTNFNSTRAIPGGALTETSLSTATSIGD